MKLYVARDYALVFLQPDNAPAILFRYAATRQRSAILVAMFEPFTRAIFYLFYDEFKILLPRNVIFSIVYIADARRAGRLSL